MSEHTNAAKKALKNLLPQRRKFVEAFCACFNATKAALAAGYSEKTARTQGSRLLTFVDVKNAVKLVLDTAAMDPEEIAARWTALASAGLDDFYRKVEYDEVPKITRPLIEQIAELEYKYDFEQRVADRQTLTEKELKTHAMLQARRRNEIIRLEVELEMNPGATYQADGPPVKAYRMELDLVKAADLGLLDLAKAITPTEFGMKVELRSPDEALNNLAKYRGMLTTKIDLTSKGEQLAAPPLLGALSFETKKAILEARRKAVAQQEGGANV